MRSFSIPLIAVLALIPASYATAQIPTAERDALIALYNSTDGDNWSHNTGWLGAAGTECSWDRVYCDGGHVSHLQLNSNQLNGSIPVEFWNLPNLVVLQMNQNQLTGSIPPEVENLSSLTELDLSYNNLSGSIPAEFGVMSDLGWVTLNDNQFSGNIPPELGNMANLRMLNLHNNLLSGVIPAELGNLPNPDNFFQLALSSNQLSGSIPPELGNLSSLQYLYLESCRLSGDIPSNLENLSALSSLDLRWNSLHSNNATLITFLNGAQWLGDWQSTQTIAPENLAVDSVGDHTAWLSWDAVSYQSDPGGYEVFSSPTGAGVWTSQGWTESKADTTYPATGLDPGTTYDFAVVTYTDPHADNLNLVNSDFSSEVMATTATGGCAQPTIEIAWGDPITLSVSGSWDSYLWNTAETTSTIDIAPLFDQWYWVTVASTGPCEETGTVWLDPTSPIFLDGFESGDTTEWSSAVP